MISMADYLVGRNLPPPPPVGVGRVVTLLAGTDDGDDPSTHFYVCDECGVEKSGDHYYYRIRKSGAVHRLPACNKCHMANVAKNARLRRARRSAK